MSNTVIQEVEQDLGAFVPFTGIVNTGLSVANKVLDVVTPPILSAEADKPTNEQKDRLAKYESILDNPNEAIRGQQLAAFCDQLCLDARLPVGFLSGRTIRVPVEHFTAFIDGVGQLIEEREQAAAQANKSK